MCNLFGGANTGEKTAAANEANLAKVMSGDFAQRFAGQTDVLQQLALDINRISSGDTGMGFGAAEMAARTGQIESGAGAMARNIEQATRNENAGQVFGLGVTATSGLRSGIQRQLDETAVSRAEAVKADALTNLTAQNFAAGREKAYRTEAGLQNLAGAYDPTKYGAMASGANEATFGMQSKINAEDSSGGLIGGLLMKGLQMAGSFASGGLSNLGAGESVGEGIGDFFKGGIGALSGNG